MASLNGSITFIVHNSPLGPGPKTHCWGQAPRSNLSAGARPQSKVLNIAAATFFVMKGVAAARFLVPFVSRKLTSGVRPRSEVLIKDLQIFVFLEIMSYLCTRIWLKIQEKLFRH